MSLQEAFSMSEDTSTATVFVFGLLSLVRIGQLWKLRPTKWAWVWFVCSENYLFWIVQTFGLITGSWESIRSRSGSQDRLRSLSPTLYEQGRSCSVEICACTCDDDRMYVCHSKVFSCLNYKVNPKLSKSNVHDLTWHEAWSRLSEVKTTGVISAGAWSFIF